VVPFHICVRQRRPVSKKWRPSWIQDGTDGHNFERGPPKDHSDKAWLKLAKWTLSGESGDVNVTIVSEWKSKLPNLIKDYHPRDIYNMDETGLFNITLR
jgi:hypothetical protein